MVLKTGGLIKCLRSNQTTNPPPTVLSECPSLLLPQQKILRLPLRKGKTGFLDWETSVTAEGIGVIWETGGLRRDILHTK